jgi:hypothetical protein
MGIHVISTSFDPPPQARARCLASIEQADGWTYIDAAAQPKPLSHFENLFAATSRMWDDTIIVCVDGDDWLLPGAIERVRRAYAEGAEATFGSFRYADGRPGFARQMTPAERANPRAAPWVATHLKTFQLSAFRRIPVEYFRDANGWLTHARDMALMFPLLETCKVHFIPDELYVYNYANSTEFRGNAETLAAEREAVRHVRGMKRCTT